tara:strand:+ start:7231 stop:8205 length:975 start_codon:yes stop_codon:yes gene_type:complete
LKKILVTGAAGFIGSHFVELLVKNGHSVIAFDRYNSNNNWGWLEDSPCIKDIEVILGDVRDFDSVNKAMKGCDSVFHLAALIGIPYSYISPMAYLKTNIEGTYNILESAKILDLENILIASTSETYGSAQYVPIDEIHPQVGQSPYSASKIAADNIALSYYYSFDLPLKIFRPFNTYGPRQSARAIIPTIITQILDGKEAINLGNVSPTRDLTYVLDTCDAIYDIFDCSKLNGEIVNIGMNEEISIQDLFSKICDLMKASLKIIQDNNRIRPSNSEVDRLMCNNDKLKRHTKWKPSFNINKGLLLTIDWIKQNRHLFKNNIYNI